MEHSSTDGTPAITQDVHAHGYTVPVPDLPISPEQLPALEELKWDISPLVSSYITDAKYKLLELSNKLSVKVFSFRHLFGLQMIAKQHDMSLKFFSDLGYTRNTYFRLSTSQLPIKQYLYFGYASLVEDGL